MTDVACVTIGFYTYAITDDFLPTFLEAVARGSIREVTKHHIGGAEYKAVVGKVISTEVVRLEVITQEESEVAELKRKISELENKLND